MEETWRVRYWSAWKGQPCKWPRTKKKEKKDIADKVYVVYNLKGSRSPLRTITLEGAVYTYSLTQCKEISTCNAISHPGLAEIPALDGGPGSDVIKEGLKLETIGGQLVSAWWFDIKGNHFIWFMMSLPVPRSGERIFANTVWNSPMLSLWGLLWDPF